jgi:hypothetical protein
MRVFSLVVLMGFTLIAPASAVAQSHQNDSSPLFSKLFAPPSAPLLKAPVPTTLPEGNVGSRPLFPARSSGRIVCGMALVPVDPRFDAKIRRPVPSGKAFTMKRIKPPICGQ